MKLGIEGRQRASTGAVLALALVPPLLLAGAPGWSVPVIVALAGLALGVVVSASSSLPPRERLDVVLFGVWGFTLLQLVPLPVAWIAWLSPHRLEAVATRDLAGTNADWAPLSLDPGRTFEQALVGLGILAAYAVGRAHAAGVGRRSVVAAAALSSLIVCVLGFGHELVGATAVFGWHEPVETSPQLLSPLLNTNHFGGFAAFGAVLCLGLAAKRRRAHPLRWLWVVGSVVCGAAAILAASRGAVLSLTVGLGLAAAAMLRRSRGRRRRDVGALVLVAAAGIVGLAVYLGLERTFADFEHGDFSKLDIARASLPLALQFPWVGIGRGAFAPAFVSLDPDGSAWTTTPENLLVLWTVEWGVPVTLLLLAALGRVLWRTWTSDHREVAAASAALVAFGVHDLVDFALEMPGLVVVAALLLGALATPRREADEAPPKNRVGARRTFVLVAAGAVVGAVLTGPQVVARRPALERERLLSATTEDALNESVERLAVSHPLDPSLALYAAHGYERLGSPKALPWVNRSMQLAPGWAAPHVAASRLLLRLRAYRQALLEVREAESRQLGSAMEVACVLATRLPAEMVVELAPPETPAYLDRLARCSSVEVVSALDDAFVASGRDAPSVRARLARRAQRAGDLESAMQHARRARELDPDDEAGLLVLAEITAERQDAANGLALLGEGPASASVLRLRARLAADAGNETALDDALSRLRVLAAGRPSALANEWAFASRLEQTRGNVGAALTAAERAHQLRPDDAAYLTLVAQAAERAGQHRRAHSARAELCRRGVTSSCRPLEPRDLSRQRNRLGGVSAGETP